MNEDWDREEEWKNGFISAVRGEWAPYNMEFWAPKDQFQHGWNEGIRAIRKQIQQQKVQ